ncbi:hypothetical protein RJ639_015301 [Escallonia herrerae]|uniref:Uncharacterized protein n=1 Tax=Escallonia herrerae TaxID=1293975 RepID=A0AA89AQ44_9ASTE|nr:hypothetical protein RJ639_015301 [Escallonia herrerae]
MVLIGGHLNINFQNYSGKRNIPYIQYLYGVLDVRFPRVGTKALFGIQDNLVLANYYSFFKGKHKKFWKKYNGRILKLRDKHFANEIRQNVMV